METAFTRLVGCELPIQLAVMGGGVATPELASAVSAAGGLGMLSSAHPVPVAQQLAAADGLVGVGFFAFDLANRAADLDFAASHARVVDIFWGDPDPTVVARIHDGGALAFWQVGSRAEASSAVDAGCDVVVAQGIEAGGHVRGTTPVLDLVAAVADLGVPVVAAGGIATGAAIKRALDAGAAGVRIGTRLLASAESGAHPDYVAALIAARGGDDTVYTTAFGSDWPDAPHRVLRVAVERAEALGAAARWSAMPPASFVAGDVSAMAMYAGTGVGDITDAPPVADVIARLMAEVVG